MYCPDCGNPARRLFNDPRTPPIEEKECLCFDCYQGAVEETIDELNNTIEELTDELKIASEISQQ